MESNSVNFSVATSPGRNFEKRLFSRKTFQDNEDLLQMGSHRRLNSKPDSDRIESSRSLFEKLSQGADVDPKNYISKRRNKVKSNSLYQGNTFQKNIFCSFNDENEVPDLMYQHVQFRRIEKLMYNYLDLGFVINQKMENDNEKIQ